VQFRLNRATEKNELSCVRFEFDSIENCRQIGKVNGDDGSRKYYGLGCTNVSSILGFPSHSIAFTPKPNDTPPNIFHTDVYESALIAEDGKANTAASNLKREAFKEVWVPYQDSIDLTKDKVQPFKNLKELIYSIKKLK
jgi:hypothetical protein